ncbi:uncharacterized protein BT62DRAFT_946399 [Guyanagaster necrorhizus]|uniref:Large ribosomal subunit protein mL59 domain-containing protein n=1 Tax=Guyanagaster necrorhizus TaxID=856835 RepID=A0A9P7VYU1_9AGAR|nr:uncharacterized protein BT62DRAFT_946399 [Guyanagaster necrorhizus MCA 3950]KAG7448754.1 hypothetical protein BT62DRAFT_946399 [Guyanagaster necrorhizus MCA 3950]
MSTAAAGLSAVKRFRLHEIKGLRHHLKRYGPLPEKPDANPKALLLPNPFLPRFNPTSGRWAPPKYSLRRQAELVKQAKVTKTLHLLPPGPKLRAAEILAAPTKSPRLNLDEKKKALRGGWLSKVEWVGKVNEKQVKGAESGTRLYSGKKRMFKGHKWERVKRRRFNYKKILLRDMDQRIMRYKSYYKNRRPNPLATPQVNKKAKLPF